MLSSQPTAPRKFSFETLSLWSFIGTLVGTLFMFIPSVSVPFVATKTFVLAAGTLVTLALYILARLSRGNIVFPPALLLGALWLPVIAYALSATFSGVSFTSALWSSSFDPDTLGFILIATLLGTLAALIVRRPEHYKSFLCTAFWGFASLLVVEVLAIAAGQFFPTLINPSFSILGSFEDLAFFLGLGVVSILITLRFLELSRRTSQVLIGSMVVALMLLAIANSSVVWILVALAALGFFVEAVMSHKPGSKDADFDDTTAMNETPSEQPRKQLLFLPLAILAVALFFLVSGTAGGAVANALHVNTLSVRPSWQATFAVAHKTYGTSPVFGTGPGTFLVNWLKYRDATLNSTLFWNVDFSSGIGFIPTSFVTTGLVGALAWLLFFSTLLVLGFRMLLLRAPEDPFLRYVAILSFVAMLYLFAAAIFALPSTFMIALAFLFSGLFISATRFASGATQWGVIFSRNPRIGFIIVFSLTLLLLGSVVTAYTLVEHYAAAVDLTKAENAFSAGNLDAADQAVQHSLSFSPTASAYQVQAVIAAARVGQIVASTTMPRAAAQQAFQTTVSAGINAALTAVRLAPSDYQNWLTLGNLYAQAVPLKISGAYDSAKTAYQKAAALNPTSPQIPYIMAQLDIANSDNKSAETDLQNAITLKQDYTAAILLYSQLKVQDGNIKEALTAALAAAYFTPNDPNILFQVGILSAAEGDLPGANAALSAAVVANPQFANARYFLAAVYAKQNDYKDALVQLKAAAALSPENAKALTSQIATLAAGKNPFPANLLSSSSTPVK